MNSIGAELDAIAKEKGRMITDEFSVFDLLLQDLLLSDRGNDREGKIRYATGIAGVKYTLKAFVFEFKVRRGDVEVKVVRCDAKEISTRRLPTTTTTTTTATNYIVL